ncbi:MAG TPA: endolytic transglycosylase MltG [Solirubrobacterales bacterium]|nr:endolytic transglycosylase MltG [Solirubrobacterales bacterium]
MSDDSGRRIGDDPFVDPNDPEAVERAQRRREREEKRAQKAAKKKKDAPPPPPPQEAPPAVPRTPEQEFWDEPAEPAPPVPGQEPGGLPKADPEKAERGRKRLFGRRKDKAAAAGTTAAGGAAAASEVESAAAAPPPAPDATPGGQTPPTGEAPVEKAPPPPTGESARPKQAAPATGEQPVADAGPPTAKQPMPKPTKEEPIPPLTEAQHGPTADAPQPDPGPGTAAAPRRDPNQPTASSAVAGEPAGKRRALPPRPPEETGAGDWEPPPPRDDDWFDDHDFHDEGDPEMAGAARQGRRHGDDGGRRGGIFGALLRHPFRIVAVIVAILILLFLNSLFQPFHGDGSGHVAVKIPKGSSVGEVGDLLEKKGVISGGFIVSGSTLFQARVTLAGKRSDLFAGSFQMQKDMSYGDAIDELSQEPEPKEQSKPGIVTVTIPEGQSRPITAELVAEDGIKGSYMKATKKSKYLDPAEYGGKGAKDLEGFLFPDTWEIKTKMPVSYLVRLQLEDFKKKIKKVNMKYAKSKNLTVFDVVTIASMVEREAGVPKQRKLVASVIYNRLHEGMTLGIDSTIRFATGNYEKPLTQSELESESPYNTRTHAGLPPGPINSPGLEALQAAAHPAKTDFLFYVTDPNSCNELTFAKTEDEFFADAARYEKAREKNGGNQPSTCK